MRSRRSRRRLHRTRVGLAMTRLRRSTVVTVTVATTVAGVAASTTVQTLSAADDARRRWADTTEVVVVTRRVAALEAVPAGAVTRRRVPAALVPERPASDVAGRVTLAALVPGDIVVEERLADAIVADGHRAVGVPAPGTGAHPDVAVGDEVEVLDVASIDAPVIASGRVVGVRDTDGLVTVAVPAETAGAVAYAALGGTAVLSLIAVPPRR